jgi:hypothetical protein
MARQAAAVPGANWHQQAAACCTGKNMLLQFLLFLSININSRPIRRTYYLLLLLLLSGLMFYICSCS